MNKQLGYGVAASVKISHSVTPNAHASDFVVASPLCNASGDSQRLLMLTSPDLSSQYSPRPTADNLQAMPESSSTVNLGMQSSDSVCNQCVCLRAKTAVHDLPVFKIDHSLQDLIGIIDLCRHRQCRLLPTGTKLKHIISDCCSQYNS